MKNGTGARGWRWGFLCAVLTAITVTSTAHAKSLYVIAQNLYLDRPLPLQAYNIGAGGRLTFQTQYGIPSIAGGAVGLAIDSDSGYLFITYEFTNEIRVVDATTMDAELVAAAQGAQDLAGIVYDQSRDLLYCMDRYTPTLNVYRWDPAQKGLVPSVPVQEQVPTIQKEKVQAATLVQDGRILYELGKLYRERGENEKAMEAYERALAAHFQEPPSSAGRNDSGSAARDTRKGPDTRPDESR